MRSISGQTIWMVVVLYWFFTSMSWYSVRLVLQAKMAGTRRMFTFLFWGLAAFQTLLFLFFYAFPPVTFVGRKFVDYFLFNGILLADFVSKVPLSLSTLLILPRRRAESARKLAFTGLILSTGFLGVMVWGMIPGRTSLYVNEVTLEPHNLPSALDGLRIVQLSDLHAGNFSNTGLGNKMVEVCNEFQPDYLFFTGDLVNNFAWEVSRVEPWMRQLRATKGKYAIPGNHDYGDYSLWNSPEAKALNLEGIKNAYARLGFRLLLNESVRLYYKGDSLYLTGVENWGHPPYRRYANLQKAEKGIPSDVFRILLTHDPAHWDSEVKFTGRFPLTFSGHTHGFQWGIKLAGIPFSTAWFYNRKWGGTYQCDSSMLVVNKGMGTIGLQFRIDMPSEITLITLRKK